MKSLRSSIELLEARIAPATLTVSGSRSILTYTDLDGDFVRVTFNKPMAAGDFTLSSGALVNDGSDGKVALDRIDLTGKTGASFTLSAKPQKIAGVLRGDSHANVGSVRATGTDLGAIVIDGDLRGITAGFSTTSAGVKSLTVLSMGAQQAANSSTVSTLTSAGTITVKTSANDVNFNVTGDVKSLSIGGNFGDLNSSLSILSIAGNVGTLKIGGDVTGLGGRLIIIGGTTGSFTIGGDIIGGTTNVAGHQQVELGTSVKTLTIGGDLRGNTGNYSGSLGATNAGTVKIGGSLIGSTGQLSGSLKLNGTTKSLTIGGDLRGRDVTGSPNGTGLSGGSVDVDDVGKVTIGGSMIGGAAAAFSGSFLGGTIGSFTIGKSIQARGTDNNSSSGSIVLTGNLGSLKVGGDIAFASTASANSNEPTVSIVGTLGSLTVGGGIFGSSDRPAYLLVGGVNAPAGSTAIKTISVKQSVDFARIVAGWSRSPQGTAFSLQNEQAGIGSVAIGGNLRGSQIEAGCTTGGDGIIGTSDDSLIANSNARIDSVKIGGSFQGITNDSRSYYIQAPVLKKVTLGKATYTNAQIGSFLDFYAIGKASLFQRTPVVIM